MFFAGKMAVVTLILSAALPASIAASGFDDDAASEEYRIGLMVKHIAAAIELPADPASLETVAGYGTDSRYYVMIRGWLVQELRGVESQLTTERDDDTTSLQQKADFLRRAIRRIDLE